MNDSPPSSSITFLIISALFKTRGGKRRLQGTSSSSTTTASSVGTSVAGNSDKAALLRAKILIPFKKPLQVSAATAAGVIALPNKIGVLPTAQVMSGSDAPPSSASAADGKVQPLFVPQPSGMCCLSIYRS